MFFRKQVVLGFFIADEDFEEVLSVLLTMATILISRKKFCQLRHQSQSHDVTASQSTNKKTKIDLIDLSCSCKTVIALAIMY